jgi:hypothetical protein
MMHRIDQEIKAQKNIDLMAHRLVIAIKKFYQENHPEALNTRARGLPSIVLTIMVLAYLQYEIGRQKIPGSLVDAINRFMRFYRNTFDNTRFLIDSDFTFQPIPEIDKYKSSMIVQDPLGRLFNEYSIINIAQSVDLDMLRGLGIFDYKSPRPIQTRLKSSS